MFDTNLISLYSHKVFFSLVILFFIFPAIKTNAQQQSISVVDQMQPSPVNYQMRDWKKVALGYDSLVFNKNLTGEYLPLVSFSTNSINYPGNNWFWLQTVVGSTDLNKAEAINVLPAVVGAYPLWSAGK